MIRYSLDIEPEKLPAGIGIRDKVIFTGSCFSEHIADRLKQLRFDVYPHPNGIVFNPESLCKPFTLLQAKARYEEKDLVQRDDIWFSKYHHGAFYNTEKQELLAGLNEKQQVFERYLKEAHTMFVTFGTAWIYIFKETGEIAANCHKIPQARFSKRLLEVAEVVKAWQDVITFLEGFNPRLQVVFTVSPVKHLRDGVVGNTISKSILILAVRELVRNHANCYYFPAFELVNDDLRDYRFYEQDGAHPNKEAIEYVFDKFERSCLTAQAIEFAREVKAYNSLSGHRPIHASSPGAEAHSAKLAALKQELESRYNVKL